VVAVANARSRVSRSAFAKNATEVATSVVMCAAVPAKLNGKLNLVLAIGLEPRGQDTSRPSTAELTRCDHGHNVPLELKAQGKMAASRALWVATILGTVVQAQPARPEVRLLTQTGSYEITARLELPHLERWAVDKTAIICLPPALTNNEVPIPIVSANNPYAKCSAKNLTVQSNKLEYDIVCPERGSAKGHAVYILSDDAFSGRVAMVLGAKNMTMTEVQQARRIGNCSPLTLGSAARF
jgi:hypothetical protein